MDELLHPSSLSEILDRTAQIYRARFLVFLGIAFIPTAVLLALIAVVAAGGLLWGFNGIEKAPPEVVGFVAIALAFALVLVALPILLAVTALATAAMNHAASRAFLGQTTTIRDAYKAVWRRGWRFIGLFAFQIVVIWVVPFGAWFVLTLLNAGLSALLQSSGVGGGGLFLLAGFLVFCGLVTYGFWMALRVSLAFPACVVEQIGVWDGLKRSASLTKGTKGRILLLYLLGVALNWILSLAIAIPLIVVMALLPNAYSPQHAQAASIILVFVIYGSAFAVQALTRPVYGIALMLFYYDQRIRQEAFDIEWMMLRAGLVVPTPTQPPASEAAETQAENPNSPEAPPQPTQQPTPSEPPPDAPPAPEPQSGQSPQHDPSFEMQSREPAP